MEDWAADLLAVLKREEEIIKLLLEQAAQKTEALKTGNVVGIDGIVNREQPLVLRLRAEEQKREALLDAHRLGGLSLSALCQRAGAASRALLLEKLESMRAMCEELRLRNDLNSRLAMSRLEFYNMLAGGRRSLYENDGRQKTSEESLGLMDQKI